EKFGNPFLQFRLLPRIIKDLENLHREQPVIRMLGLLCLPNFSHPLVTRFASDGTLIVRSFGTSATSRNASLSAAPLNTELIRSPTAMSNSPHAGSNKTRSAYFALQLENVINSNSPSCRR